MAGQLGVAYSGSLALDVSDADSDPLTFAKTGGAAWLSVAANGALSGTPTVEGLSAATVTVSDGVHPAVSGNIEINVPATAPTGVVLAVDFHLAGTDPVPTTPDYFVGWAVSNVNAGVAAPSTNINGYGVTVGSGASIACLTTPALQEGMNARNRSAGYIPNAGSFTQADMMRERLASAVAPIDPATGNGTGSGIYLKISGLAANAQYEKDKVLLFQCVSSENCELCIGFGCNPTY